jgi:hypothetical protein
MACFAIIIVGSCIKCAQKHIYVLTINYPLHAFFCFCQNVTLYATFLKKKLLNHVGYL